MKRPKFEYLPDAINGGSHLRAAAQWLQQCCDQLEAGGVDRDRVARLRCLCQRFDEHGRVTKPLHSQLRQLAERLERVW